MKTLRSSFCATVGGGQPAVLIRTDEPDEAAYVVSEVAKEYRWHLWVWDFVGGLTVDDKPKPKAAAGRGADPLGKAGDGPTAPGGVVGLQQALRALAAFENVERENGQTIGFTPVVLVLKNLPMVAPAPEARQEIANHLKTYEAQNKCVVGFGHASSDLPPEVRSAFTLIDHELPGPEDLAKVALSIGGTNDWAPTADEIVEMAENGLGLTRLQFKNIVSSYLFDPREACAEFLDDPEADPVLPLPAFIWRMKTEILNKEGLVQVLNPKFGFDKLGGLQGMKDFHKRLLTSVKLQGTGKDKPKAKARGTMLVSGPGMGKTTFIECLAHEVGAGAVMMDFGSMLGGHVGDTEKTTRRAFAVVDAIAPREATTSYKVSQKDIDTYGDLIVPVMKKLGEGTKVRFLVVGWDEVEKALSGANAGHNAGLDSGVNSRQFEFVLRWLTARKSRTFVVATANTAANLNAAFTRSGRFTAVFYLEKPDRDQKDDIWRIAVGKYGLERTGPVVVRQGKKFRAVDPLKGGTSGSWVGEEAAATTFADAAEADELIDALGKGAKGAEVFPRLPDDTDWTGAEIDDCCEKAYLLDKSLVDAARHVVPVFKRDKEGQAALEEWARGATLSARTGQLYGTEMVSVGDGSSFGGRVRRTVKRAAQPAAAPAAAEDDVAGDD